MWRWPNPAGPSSQQPASPCSWFWNNRLSGSDLSPHIASTNERAPRGPSEACALVLKPLTQCHGVWQEHHCHQTQTREKWKQPRQLGNSWNNPNLADLCPQRPFTSVYLAAKEELGKMDYNKWVQLKFLTRFCLGVFLYQMISNNLSETS